MPEIIGAPEAKAIPKHKGIAREIRPLPKGGRLREIYFSVLKPA